MERIASDRFRGSFVLPKTMNADPHDIRKAEIEDRLIRAAEDRAQCVGLGKAAFEAYEHTELMREFRARFELFCDGPRDWSALSPDSQCAWVAAAQAVLREAIKGGLV